MWLSDTIAQEIVWSDEDDFIMEYEDEAPWSDADYDQDDWDFLAEDTFIDGYWETQHEIALGETYLAQWG